MHALLTCTQEYVGKRRAVLHVRDLSFPTKDLLAGTRDSVEFGALRAFVLVPSVGPRGQATTQ